MPATQPALIPLILMNVSYSLSYITYYVHVIFYVQNATRVLQDLHTYCEPGKHHKEVFPV